MSVSCMPKPALRLGLQRAGQAALTGLRSWASGVESTLARGAAALTPDLPDIDAREAASVLLAISGVHLWPSPTQHTLMPCMGCSRVSFSYRAFTLPYLLHHMSSADGAPCLAHSELARRPGSRGSCLDPGSRAGCPRSPFQPRRQPTSSCNPAVPLSDLASRGSRAAQACLAAGLAAAAAAPPCAPARQSAAQARPALQEGGCPASCPACSPLRSTSSRAAPRAATGSAAGAGQALAAAMAACRRHLTEQRARQLLPRPGRGQGALAKAGFFPHAGWLGNRLLRAATASAAGTSSSSKLSLFGRAPGTGGCCSAH